MREFAKWASVCFLFLNLGHQNIQSNDETSFINDTTRSETYPSGQVHAPPVSDRETCTRGREGPRTYAGVAISARDMSVGEVISDHPL